MLKNRLKIVRKARGYTQKQVADVIGITQHAYSYWEASKVRIDSDSLNKLADFFKVPIDFLCGRDYVMQKPYSDWRQDQQEDYDAATREQQIWYEYVWGNIKFNEKKWDTEYGIPTNNRVEYKFEEYGLRPISTKRFPMLGEIACGQPKYAEQDYESYVDASAAIDADFCLTATGDSMINARIQNGDTVFIKEMPIVQNGDIAAVIIEGEATLKYWHYYPDKHKLILLPANPSYEPFTYIGEELESVVCLGKAVYFMSKL